LTTKKEPDYKNITEDYFIIDGEYCVDERLVPKLTEWIKKNNQPFTRMSRDELKKICEECGVEFIETYEK